MKTEMMNEMVTLNDEEMSKVNGGYEQHGPLTPMHSGYNTFIKPTRENSKLRP